MTPETVGQGGRLSHTVHVTASPVKPLVELCSGPLTFSVKPFMNILEHASNT